MNPPVSVILIRESPRQVSLSGCCGQIEATSLTARRSQAAGSQAAGVSAAAADADRQETLPAGLQKDLRAEHSAKFRAVPAAAALDERRRQQEALGIVYRAVAGLFPPVEGQPQVSVTAVDPRNQLYLAARLVRDVWRYRPPWRAAVRTLSQAFRLPAVVVNGEALGGGGVVDPDTVCRRIALLLRQARRRRK